jgi:hypothetical protein
MLAGKSGETTATAMHDQSGTLSQLSVLDQVPARAKQYVQPRAASV